jgi:DNA helicase-2/ATP-dependent DNA helicase PcrA
MNEGSNAFELTSHVAKKTGLVQELKKDGTPEGIARIENIEELLNGIKDFVEGQVEVADATGALAEFLEDVALATDMDNDKGDDDRVALMTIHLAKGLEFPHVYIVGMEEDLFPSGMSMNTRSELEEERRLFYVALTRAEKQAYLTYTISRYRWGKLVDAEPSRFIEEIDEKYLDYITPVDNYRFKPLIDNDIFGEVDKSKLRLQTPKTGRPPVVGSPTAEQVRKLRKLKPQSSDSAPASPSLFDGDLVPGTKVEHTRFGRGEILKIDGVGADRKAEIRFQVGGIKKLLLRFAKLKVIG